jgi:hypothetical protein
MSAENCATAVRATVWRRARRGIHTNGRDAARLCSWRWWSTLFRSIGPEFLAAQLLLEQASVCASTQLALFDRLRPLDGRVDKRFPHRGGAKRCDTIWCTTVTCGRRPRAHWGASASPRSLALVHRCARKRIPTHPKRACAHAARRGLYSRQRE